MTQPSGWYDDPNDASLLRYWDGVVWTSHVAPRKSPTVDQSGIGAAQDLAGTAPYGSQGSQGRQGQRGEQGQHGQQPPVAPPWQGVQLGRPQPTTPDGVLLSGWWRRVAARIVDGVICAVLTAVVTFPALSRAAGIMSEFFRASIDAAQTGGTPPPAPVELASALLPVSLASIVIYMAYEIVLLTWRGTTPGRRLVGISVRLRERPGPPPLSAVVRRTFVKEAGSIVGLLPVVGILGSLFTILDSLWPLWDERRQALHDKAGATNVVLGQQPRGSA
jgi:uncharacterized RDD family membrane protein YckC